ncbi:hypothetical protein RhiirA4_545711 [Rhizophagus irregularis]|uniref:Uncharacterized protein n=1 Tax=Rhizophagus irregularis TaxID=588596 RepID=A0A2I1GU58_9GLOM|nr:hypothetical protein RhiirA4_545711 [Rhizophagus irregularis]
MSWKHGIRNFFDILLSKRYRKHRIRIFFDILLLGSTFSLRSDHKNNTGDTATSVTATSSPHDSGTSPLHDPRTSTYDSGS